MTFEGTWRHISWNKWKCLIGKFRVPVVFSASDEGNSRKPWRFWPWKNTINKWRWRLTVSWPGESHAFTSEAWGAWGKGGGFFVAAHVFVSFFFFGWTNPSCGKWFCNPVDMCSWVLLMTDAGRKEMRRYFTSPLKAREKKWRKSKSPEN